MTTMVADQTAGQRSDLSAAKQALLEKRLRGAGAVTGPASGIPRRARAGAAPLSFAQQRLWFLNLLEPDQPLYNMLMPLRIRGGLDLDGFQKTLDAIAARHESLRTRFASGETGPVQFSDTPPCVPLRVIDLSAQPAAQREARGKQMLEDEARRPFDLSRDLMLRGLLVRLDESEWLLLLVMHHIAADAWSWSIFCREFSALYPTLSAGRSESLPELPVQYADFAVWQRQSLQGDVLNQHLAYWKEHLADAPGFLELPADHPRPPVQTFRGAWESLVLPENLRHGLEALSRHEGATLFMTLLAAFQTLLHRYTQQADILVGTPVAGRTQIETEPLIGFFINTLVLRTRFDGDLTFRRLLRQVRESTLEAFVHQDLPFDKLVEELQPERSSSHLPLVQIMFVLQNAPVQNLQLPGATVTPIALDTGTAKFDLTLSIAEERDGFTAAIEYNADLFTPPTIRRMLGHFQALLEGIVADPDQSPCELPLLPTAERRQLLVEWNNTRTEYPANQCIQQLFEEQVDRTPDAVAVVFEDQHLTYRELNARANRLAHGLRRRGVGPDRLVGLCLERSVELIVALLGVLKAGGAYVPLEPSYPRERLRFLLEDTRVSVLLTQEKFRQRWSELTTDAPATPPGTRAQPDDPQPVLVCLDRDQDGLDAEMTANPVSGTTADHLAYVSFTSGSTGRPKGVCIPHRGVVRLVKTTDYARLTRDEVFLQLAPVAFDASTLEIWGPLLNGARLVIFPPRAPSLAELGEVIQAHRVTTLWLTAGLFNQIVEERLDCLKNVRQLLVGGDVLSPAHVRRAIQNLPGCRLINGYGPTENTTFTCCHPIREVPAEHRSIPIGRPIANTQVYVLDAHRQPVPIGVPGELFTGGDGLARGYLNQPDLTAEKFIAHPFSHQPGARLYRTGDLVRYLPGGDLEFLGRVDLQVKIRGFRVEPGEIEAVLSRHPAVHQCAVVPRQDASEDKQLVAYVVPAPAAASAAGELRAFLQEKLPDYMVPSAFVRLDALPLTPNGKLDRRALPPPGPASATATRKFVAPRDPVETHLVTLWEHVLGLHPIGITDQFFALGGHSLLAVRLIAQIERHFGQRLPVAAIFQAPTIEQQAGLLRQPRRIAPGSSLVEIQPRGTRPPLFLVHGVGGGMFWGYTNLSRSLGANQPVYAFKSRAMDGLEEFQRIEDMAAHYVQNLRSFQREGPYYLGGYCFGGNVAYEMARQLQAAGQTVGLLALMDCTPPNSTFTRGRWSPVFLARFLANAAYWFGYFLRWDAAQRRGFLLWKTRMLRRKLARWLSRGGARRRQCDVEDVVDLSTYLGDQRKLWEAHIRALIDHHPQPYAGQVTLFRTRGYPWWCSFDPQYGWSDLVTGGVTVRVVPGAHESILAEPHVAALAEALTEFLPNHPTTQTNEKTL
ncbi:MAG: non-ribosomal peptide synthetase [Limisphaerales bacterium]